MGRGSFIAISLINKLKTDVIVSEFILRKVVKVLLRTDGRGRPAFLGTQSLCKPVIPLGIHAQVEVAQPGGGPHVDNAPLGRELHVIYVSSAARLELHVYVPHAVGICRKARGEYF